MEFIMFELTPEEVTLIRLIRGIKFGTIQEITIRDGKPKLIKNAIQTVDLERLIL